eukprot:scpid23185/ scgid15488/ 
MPYSHAVRFRRTYSTPTAAHACPQGELAEHATGLRMLSSHNIKLFLERHLNKLIALPYTSLTARNAKAQCDYGRDSALIYTYVRQQQNNRKPHCPSKARRHKLGEGYK